LHEDKLKEIGILEIPYSGIKELGTNNPIVVKVDKDARFQLHYFARTWYEGFLSVMFLVPIK
jgi:hypothetical protein